MYNDSVNRLVLGHITQQMNGLMKWLIFILGPGFREV